MVKVMSIKTKIINFASLYYYKRKWRKLNEQNNTWLVRLCDISKISVGKFSYGPLKVHTWGSENEKLTIGNFVSISSDVTFILGGNHQYTSISTYPFKVKFLGQNEEAYSNGEIKINDDVWIGMNCIIMSGITIGKGAVIAAGSVVTKDIPPYSIAGGNPAKIIKCRFNENLIKEVEKINFSNLKKQDIIDNIEKFYIPVNEEIVTDISTIN